MLIVVQTLDPCSAAKVLRDSAAWSYGSRVLLTASLTVRSCSLVSVRGGVTTIAPIPPGIFRPRLGNACHGSIVESRIPPWVFISDERITPVPHVSLDTFASAYANGAQIVDVRENDEYASGHVPGAIHIPMGQLTDRLREIDDGRPVYVICASGNRSSAMTDVLVHHGFDAFSVNDGTGGWVAAGHPTDLGAFTRRA